MSSFFPARRPQNYMADQQRLQISELHFGKFPTRSTFSCWKIRFKAQVSSCSGFPSEAMSWIKELELVESVDDLKSSRSIQDYTHFPNFEMLDAKIASALNKIATEHVRELDLFVTVMLLEDTPTVLTLGKLCEGHKYTYLWTSGQKTTYHQKWQENQLQHSELCTIRCPCFVNEFLHVIFTYFFNNFIARYCDWHGGDLITADHKVLGEGCESRNNHRYAVVVQVLATQWLQSWPCKNENFSGNPEEPYEVPGADEETESHLH